MSRWNRPMRQYAPSALVCKTCGQPVRTSSVGWTHVRRMLLRDWHPVAL